MKETAAAQGLFACLQKCPLVRYFGVPGTFPSRSVSLIQGALRATAGPFGTGARIVGADFSVNIVVTRSKSVGAMWHRGASKRPRREPHGPTGGRTGGGVLRGLNGRWWSSDDGWTPDPAPRVAGALQTNKPQAGAWGLELRGALWGYATARRLARGGLQNSPQAFMMAVRCRSMLPRR
jgi:hypothetical protein